MEKPFRFTFRKEERLCSKKLLDELFLSKQSVQFFQFPLKAFWLFTDSKSIGPVQVVFPVSKRLFKRAHDRNRIRRMMRESFRLQKNDLYRQLAQQNLSGLLSISYIAKEKVEYQQIYHATNKLLESVKKIASHHSNIHPINTDSDL